MSSYNINNISNNNYNNTCLDIKEINLHLKKFMLERALGSLFIYNAISEHLKAKFLYKPINFDISVTKSTQQLLKGVTKC